jgi:hypothetical protein
MPPMLAAKVEWVWTQVEGVEEMGRSALREGGKVHAANCRRPMEIYELALANHRIP